MRARLRARMTGRWAASPVVHPETGEILVNADVLAGQQNEVSGGILPSGAFAVGYTDYTGALGTNAYDNGAINMPGAFVLETVLTAAFVLVILREF